MTCYNYSIDTPVLVSAEVDSTVCLPLPLHLLSTGETLLMVWPKKLHSQGDCSCLPYQGSAMQFSECASSESCNTEYSITIQDNVEACFNNLTLGQSNTPVYFTVVRVVPCLLVDGTVSTCYIRRIATSYNILLTEGTEVPGIAWLATGVWRLEALIGVY